MVEDILGRGIAISVCHLFRWSAAWEACLWSRLREPDLALVALLKLFQRYTAPNFMGLHPVLVRSNPDCRTCFAHHFHNQEVVEAPKRGLVDKHGSVVSISSDLIVTSISFKLMPTQELILRFHK